MKLFSDLPVIRLSGLVELWKPRNKSVSAIGCPVREDCDVMMTCLSIKELGIDSPQVFLVIYEMYQSELESGDYICVSGVISQKVAVINCALMPNAVRQVQEAPRCFVPANRYLVYLIQV